MGKTAPWVARDAPIVRVSAAAAGLRGGRGAFSHSPTARSRNITRLLQLESSTVTFKKHTWPTQDHPIIQNNQARRTARAVCVRTLPYAAHAPLSALASGHATTGVLTSGHRARRPPHDPPSMALPWPYHGPHARRAESACTRAAREARCREVARGRTRTAAG